MVTPDRVGTAAEFQSTRPHEARPAICDDAGKVFAVSIHAPARGATPGKGENPAKTGSFNPRARTRRDAVSVDEYGAAVQFQSTRPHEARRLLCCGV